MSFCLKQKVIPHMMRDPVCNVARFRGCCRYQGRPHFLRPRHARPARESRNEPALLDPGSGAGMTDPELLRYSLRKVPNCNTRFCGNDPPRCKEEWMIRNGSAVSAEAMRSFERRLLSSLSPQTFSRRVQEANYNRAARGAIGAACQPRSRFTWRQISNVNHHSTIAARWCSPA